MATSKTKRQKETQETGQNETGRKAGQRTDFPTPFKTGIFRFGIIDMTFEEMAAQMMAAAAAEAC
jgi:hypothetical protein